MLPKTADIVIIGGGVMGASAAYHLLTHPGAGGTPSIVLLDRDEFFGNGATGRCAGGVRVQFATEVNIQLSLHSLRMFEQFEEQLDQPINLRRCGGLFLLSNEIDLTSFRKSVALQNRLGAETRIVNPGEIAVLAPSLRLDGIIGGSYNPQDGLVDPNSVVQGYIRAARKWGATLLTD
ncbi:MAG: FAD-binding oxidoreductase, partial [Anaerolineae bacterium]|nr:FAD-binding oxidoreductase [Anaerolineae bacterium]